MNSTKAEAVSDELRDSLARRLTSASSGTCLIDMLSGFLKLSRSQTCGKCTPCRIGLKQIETMLDQILDGQGTYETLEQIRTLALNVRDTADCALGTETAAYVLNALDNFKEEFTSHIETGRCPATQAKAIPCVATCPAHVDIPGYVSLVGAGRYADAVRLIRKDNPFPLACAMVCEHPCEKKCRRNVLDDAVNIRGLKLSAVENAGIVEPPVCAPSTGKKIAIIGGGPSGLTAAYFLQLMGHQCDVYEKRPRLGGMLVYGIPNYRLPRTRLQEDIDCILKTGVNVHLNTNIGEDITFDQLRASYDAVYLSNGAHTDKKVGIEGEDAEGVLSAVEILGAIGNGVKPDFSGKTVCVIGGGNVAMDCTRSAIRLGAASVKTVYRRRACDMTALPEEIEGAIGEGAEIVELSAPVRIEKDEKGCVAALWVSPKMIGGPDRSGRPAPCDSGKPDVRIPCDIVLVAIGQNIDSAHFEAAGVPTKRGQILTKATCEVSGLPGVFSGGDCATGPATVIRAIAAGKTAAANIDSYLGFHHIISVDVELPPVPANDSGLCGRINMIERPAAERKDDFELMEKPMNETETKQEASRCLHCDHYGYACFKNGRKKEW